MAGISVCLAFPLRFFLLFCKLTQSQSGGYAEGFTAGSEIHAPGFSRALGRSIS